MYDIYITNIENNTDIQTLYNNGPKNKKFIQVGDSISYWDSNMSPIGLGKVRYGDYSYLAGTVAYFSEEIARLENSFANARIAAIRGGTAGTLISVYGTGSTKYHPVLCEDKTPLECEIDEVNPSFAIVRIGTNDAGGSLANYENNLTAILEYLIDRNIVPILGTIPVRTVGPNTSTFNDVLISVANDLNVPLVDIRTPLNTLENKGLCPDGIHPNIPTNANTADFTSTGLQYGYNLTNLMFLESLRLILNHVTGVEH